MTYEAIINWLLEGDIAIKYQVHRDLLDTDFITLLDMKAQVNQGDYAKKFLSKQHAKGHWGSGFYQPKWTSTHYTLLDMRNLCMETTDPILKELLHILDVHMGSDGGVNPSGTINKSDICINGMFLNYASHFGVPGDRLHSIVDFIIDLHMPDGGYNCRINRSGAHHSSVHSTICVLEGIRTYFEMGYTYRLEELLSQEKAAREFLLMHHLYKSDKTGEIIHKNMTMLAYPYRWKYNFLRALDYFRSACMPYDNRMEDALQLLLSKRRKDGTWPVQAKHSGEVHFDMEATGKSSRWNTLIALRVLKFYEKL